MIANVRKGLEFVIASAPQLTKLECWKALIQYIIARILPVANGKEPSPPNRPHPDFAGARG